MLTISTPLNMLYGDTISLFEGIGVTIVFSVAVHKYLTFTMFHECNKKLVNTVEKWDDKCDVSSNANQEIVKRTQWLSDRTLIHHLVCTSLAVFFTVAGLPYLIVTRQLYFG